MKRMLGWMVSMAAVLVVSGCGKQEAQTVQPSKLGAEVAVWVDQTGITGAQIQREASRLFSHVPKDLPAEQMPMVQARLLNQAIDNLVVRQLVRAEMERTGTVITRDELEKGKQDLEKALGPGGSLTMLLANANVPMEELEMNLKLDIFKNKMTKDQLAEAVAAVTEETAREFYEANLKEFTEPAGRLAWHILVRVPAGAAEGLKTEARAKAEGVRQALLEGADFAQLAREKSDCTSRARGGELGVVPRGREAKEFEDAVYGQEIGAIGAVVESPVGFHVIKVTGEQDEKVLPFEQVKDRLVVVLRGRAQQKVAADYVKSLRERATIKLDGPLAAAVAEAEKTAADEKPAAGILDAAPVTAPASAP
ncbi:MAG: peptidylprolyl isomerase [Kiritimatiellia bacterium]